MTFALKVNSCTNLVTFLEDLITNFYVLLVQIFTLYEFTNNWKFQKQQKIEKFYYKYAKTAPQIELARTFH